MTSTPVETMRERAEVLLRQLTGNPGSEFHDGQWEAISALVEGRGRALVVQRTGWGKSAVYFLTTRLLRDEGAGPTILVSPLLALMRNQIQMAERAGVRAATINSANVDDWDDIERGVKAGEVDLLLISPERLNNHRFRSDVMPALVRQVGLLVVDEAHCISDWGHDFRPDYRRISRVLGLLPPGVPVLCTTATANDRVVDDVVEQLGHDLVVQRGPLDRESLALQAVNLPGQADRLAWLAEAIPTLPGSGIVYCLTVADTERVARWLRSRGIDARSYSGDTDPADRLLVEEALLANDLKVVVATSALGMGFDKPDVAFVIHYQSPGSAIAYYQQVGRAGRALDRSVGVLLCGAEDRDIQDFFIRTAFPPRDQAEAVVELLENAGEPVSVATIETVVNSRRSRLEAMLKILEVEGAVERADRGWQRTLRQWDYPEGRVEQVTALRRAEQQAMVDYAATEGCRMTFLRDELDDRGAAPCGRCDRCTGAPVVSVTVESPLVAAALAFLRSSALIVEPRRQWPTGLDHVKGRIAKDELVESGRALCVAGDGGWGRVVDKARSAGEPAPDPVIAALAELIPVLGSGAAPTWVTSVPSTSAPDFVTDLAERVAAAAGLPYHPVVTRVRAGRPQSEQQNSAQQVGNVTGAFAVARPLPAGPVLLIDDTVDSRWTMTVVGQALRRAGCPAVLPLFLALAAGAS